MISAGFIGEFLSRKRIIKNFLFLKTQIKTNFLFLSFLILTASIFLFLRLFNFENRFNFDYDMEATANAAWSILVDKKISLIGQETSVRGLFTGPGLQWFQTTAMFLGNLNPISLGYLGVIVSLSTMMVLFLIVKEITNEWQALIAAFLFSISTRQIIYDLSANSLAYMPIFSLALFYFIYKVLIQKMNFLLPFIFLTLAIGFHIHFFLPFLYILALIVLLAIFRPRIDAKTWILSIVLFLIPLVTFVAFDLRHQFLITNNLLQFSSNNDLTIAKIAETTKIHMELLVESTFVKTRLFVLFYLVITGTYIKLMWGKSKSLVAITLILLLMPLITLWFYSGHIPEYYFLSTVPIFMIVVSSVYYYLTKKFKLLLFVLILATIYFNVSRFGDIRESPIPISTKQAVVDTIISSSRNKSFEVIYNLPLGLNTGYDYLFKWRDRIPTNNGEYLYFVSTVQDSDPIYRSSLEKFPSKEVAKTRIRGNIDIIEVK